MLDWLRLVWQTEAQLAAQDVAAVNLACAVGLPDARFDLRRCLTTLDRWAERVREYTTRALPTFLRSPEQFENSEGYFLALCLITVFQRDLGVRYNPAKIPEDAPFDSFDSFIHGVIEGDGGTCASLPVV